jgi:hypothetical protein
MPASTAPTTAPTKEDRQLDVFHPATGSFVDLSGANTTRTAQVPLRPRGRMMRPMRWIICRRFRLPATMTPTSASGTSMPSSSTRGAAITRTVPALNCSSIALRTGGASLPVYALAETPSALSVAAARFALGTVSVNTRARRLLIARHGLQLDIPSRNRNVCTQYCSGRAKITWNVTIGGGRCPYLSNNLPRVLPRCGRSAF